jgi:PelA/Pel-15E family pectate lyase
MKAVFASTQEAMEQFLITSFRPLSLLFRKSVLLAKPIFMVPLSSMPSLPLSSRLFLCFILVFEGGYAAASRPSREQMMDTMKKATRFMVEKASTQGGYVWSYSADLSRCWGELEAEHSMIWVQAPGTPAMGQLFLDAYHATGDEYYYAAAAAAANALVRGQLPCGGWNYMIDFAGEESLRQWYATVGTNAWRLEEFQHYYGNATFDDGVTRDAAAFLLRFYVEKKEPSVKAALDGALHLFLTSQHPVGAWPQRHPLMGGFNKDGHPDYSSFLTFNDEVTAGNLDFLLLWYQAFGDAGVRDAIARAMDSFLALQYAAPQAGWALQYTPDLKPAGARSYEPRALATHGTAACIEQLFRFYRLTGDRKYLARIPQALEWLESCKLPAGKRVGDRTHPTFIEIGTNRALFIHRRGSNATNGKYYVDYEPGGTVQHYSSYRRIDLAGLRATYAELAAMSPEEARKDSVLSRQGPSPLPRYFYVDGPKGGAALREKTVRTEPGDLVLGLNAEGYWPELLRMTSHAYTRDGVEAASPRDYSSTSVGDETDTSPYVDPEPVAGITTSAYIRNMLVLIRALEP